jgi:epoxyqueuosine reductase
MSIDPYTFAGDIKRRAVDAGFALCGIASADSSKYRDFFRHWLDDGRHGTMDYLAKRFDERTDPRTYFPAARSVICVAFNYYTKLDPPRDGDGRVARYALGNDYHDFIKDRLFALADWIRTQAPEAQTRIAVDTAPVMEKELAARAGIGWLAKNTLVINPDIGSWLLLGEIFTSLELPFDDPVSDRCGSCTRCIDACPTGALDTPYQLDATKCISYLTIEHRGDIAPDLANQTGDWLFGCDICQDVCPWNRKAEPSNDSDVQPRFPTGGIRLSDVLQWQPADYQQTLRKSAVKRVKLPVLQRNARVALRNLPAKSL